MLDKFIMPEDLEYTEVENFDDYDEGELQDYQNEDYLSDDYSADEYTGDGSTEGVSNELVLYTPSEEQLIRTRKIRKRVSLAGIITAPILAAIIIIILILGIILIKKLDHTIFEPDFNKVVTSGISRAKENIEKDNEKIDPPKVLTISVNSLSTTKVNFSQYFTTKGEAFDFQGYEIDDKAGKLEGTLIKDNVFDLRKIFKEHNNQLQDPSKKITRYCVKVVNVFQKKHHYVLVRFTFEKLFTIHTLDNDGTPRAFTFSKEALLQRIDVEKNTLDILDSIARQESREDKRTNNGEELNITDKLILDHKEWYLDEDRVEQFSPRFAEEAIETLKNRHHIYASERYRKDYVDKVQLVYTKKMQIKDQPSVYTNLSDDSKAKPNAKKVFSKAIEKFTQENRDITGNDIYRLSSIRFFTLNDKGEKLYLDESWKDSDPKINIPKGSVSGQIELGKKYFIYLEADRKALPFNFYHKFKANQIDEDQIPTEKISPRNIDTPVGTKGWDIDSIAATFVDAGEYDGDNIYNKSNYQIAWKYRNKFNQLKYLLKQDDIAGEDGIDANNDIDTTVQEEVRLYPHYVAFNTLSVTYKEGSVNLNNTTHNYFTIKGRRDQLIFDTIAYQKAIANSYKDETYLGTHFPIYQEDFTQVGLFYKNLNGEMKKVSPNDTFKDLLKANPNLAELEIKFSYIPINLSYNLKKTNDFYVEDEIITEGEVWVKRENSIYSENNKVLKNTNGYFETTNDIIGPNGFASLLTYFAKDNATSATTIDKSSPYFGNRIEKDPRLDKPLGELTHEQINDLVLNYELNKVSITFNHYAEDSGQKSDTLAKTLIALEYGKTLELTPNNKENFTFDKWYLDDNPSLRYTEFARSFYQDKFLDQPVNRETTLSLGDAKAYYKRLTAGKIVIRQIYTNNKNNEQIDPIDITSNDISTKFQQHILENVPLGLNFSFNFKSTGEIALNPFNDNEINKSYDFDEVAKKYFAKDEIKNKFPLKIAPGKEYDSEDTSGYFEISQETKTIYKGSLYLSQHNDVLEYNFVYTRKKATLNIKYEKAQFNNEKEQSYNLFMGRRLLTSDIPLIEVQKKFIFINWLLDGKLFDASIDNIIRTNAITLEGQFKPTEVAIYPYFVLSSDDRLKDNAFDMDQSLWPNGGYKYSPDCIAYKQDGEHKPHFVEQGTSVDNQKSLYKRPDRLPQDLIDKGFDFKDKDPNTYYTVSIKKKTDGTTPILDNLDAALRVLIPLVRNKTKIHFRKPTYTISSDYNYNGGDITNFLWLAQTKIKGFNLLNGLDNHNFIGDGSSTEPSLLNKGLAQYETDLFAVSGTTFYLVPKNPDGSLVDKIDPDKIEPKEINDFIMGRDDITIEPVIVRKQARVNIYSLVVNQDGDVVSDDGRTIDIELNSKSMQERIEILKNRGIRPIGSINLDTNNEYELTFAPQKFGYIGQYTNHDYKTNKYTFVIQKVVIGKSTNDVDVIYYYQLRMERLDYYKKDGTWLDYNYFIHGTKIKHYLFKKEGVAIEWHRDNPTGEIVDDDFQITKDLKIYGDL